jgi:hypothetical protein
MAFLILSVYLIIRIVIIMIAMLQVSKIRSQMCATSRALAGLIGPPRYVFRQKIEPKAR